MKEPELSLKLDGLRGRLHVLLGAGLMLQALLASCRSLDEGPPGVIGDRPTLQVSSTEDFELTGDGSNPAWGDAEWVTLRKREPDGLPYETRVRMLYSDTGLYFLMDGTDREVTATMTEDFMDLWNEDVFEVFLWTDERFPVYFEYEISPLNHELPILVPNFDGEFLGWRPWHYDRKKTRKATATRGGPRESGAAITGWMAEVFVPYALLDPLRNVPPTPGTRWRANFYRVDHDDGRKTTWDWSPVGPDFHEFQSYGTLEFE
jgi:hypothetical protein